MQIFSHIKIVMKNPDWTAKITCKICHLKLSGIRRSPDYDEQILSLFCTKEEDSRPASIQIMSRHPNLMKSKATGKKVQVFCWGLNDKDQLGGLKGSKVSIFFGRFIFVVTIWFKTSKGTLVVGRQLFCINSRKLNFIFSAIFFVAVIFKGNLVTNFFWSLINSRKNLLQLKQGK